MSRPPWPLAPVMWAVWLVVRLAGAAIGMTFIVVGAVLSLTVIGAIVGIPLALVGLMIAVRSIVA